MGVGVAWRRRGRKWSGSLASIHLSPVRFPLFSEDTSLPRVGFVSGYRLVYFLFTTFYLILFFSLIAGSGGQMGVDRGRSE